MHVQVNDIAQQLPKLRSPRRRLQPLCDMKSSRTCTRARWTRTVPHLRYERTLFAALQSRFDPCSQSRSSCPRLARCTGSTNCPYRGFFRATSSRGTARIDDRWRVREVRRPPARLSHHRRHAHESSAGCRRHWRRRGAKALRLGTQKADGLGRGRRGVLTSGAA